jgi:hypothetical protein
MADDEEVAAKAFAAIRSTIEKTALRLATLPKESRAEQLLLVRTTH